MTIEMRSAVDFYERHPISAEIILAKLNASRGHLDDLAPSELFAHDQDHYGGLAANDALARCAVIQQGSRVVDFCAGLGGPARYFAHRYGADVTGIELTPARISGAEELTRRVGLQDRVRVIGGNVMQVPLPDVSADAVISQEVRCAASTGLNLYDAMIAGLTALKGPKHGGAGALAAQLVRTLVDRDVAPVIRERVALGERFAGFGHGVYKHGDPRAYRLLDALAQAGAPKKFTREIPARIDEATGEFVNIDYALAVLVHVLKMPHGSELPLFAMARTVGWIAHASEQLRQGGLIRPRARYVGPAAGRSAPLRA